MHKMFYEGIESEYAGKYRDIDVFISGSQYPVAEPRRIKTEMDELFQWIETEREKIHPVVFAAQLHNKFVFIHPFKDGNGRIARLIMNTALIHNRYLLTVIPPVLRLEYIQLLEKAHRADKPFEEFIAERVLDSQKEVCAFCTCQYRNMVRVLMNSTRLMIIGLRSLLPSVEEVQ